MHRFVITARLREGSAEKVAQILREGPPFDISDTSLEPLTPFPLFRARASAKIPVRGQAR